MKTFPTLYKKSSSSTGAIQSWNISVQGNVITTVFGQIDGKLQYTSETIFEGKSLGKVNETTPEQQAEAESLAKWEKQKKKRYVESLEDAKNGKVDTDMVKGGLPPMLSISKSYPKDPILDKYLKFPCIDQTKLDGSRCIADIDNGRATLWSRTQKQIHSVPHIIQELERRFPGKTLKFDSELYNHEYHDRFEDLMSIIRSDEPDPDGLYNVIQLHVYDCPSDPDNDISMQTSYRLRAANYLSRLQATSMNTDCVIAVPFQWANNMEELVQHYESYLEQGYEGAMAKNIDAPYESGKRSSNLLKMKETQESEFEIIGVEEGRGKDAGTVGAFRCLANNNQEFKARLKATYERRRELFNNPQQWQNMVLTVRYQGLTGYGIPRFPIGKGLRSPDGA